MSKKLRYYLRGLGVGILVTVLILGVTGNKEKETLSDEEIRARAAELGMVESGSRVLTDLQPSSSAANQPAAAEGNAAGETVTADEQEAVGETKTSEDQRASGETGAEELKPGEENPAGEEQNTAGETGTEELKSGGEAGTAAEQTITENNEGSSAQRPASEGTASSSQVSASGDNGSGTVSFYIESGANSYSISKDLEAAGLIEDAGTFDTYLCNIGYSKSLRAGTYEIPLGTDEEEIVKIITGKN